MTEDQYRMGASMILLDSDRVLLVRLRDRFVERWVLPSGGIEGDEDVLRAALREMEEETGITPDQIRVLGVASRRFRYDFPSEQLTYWREHGSPFRGQEKGYVVARLLDHVELVSNDDAVDALRWARLTELSDALFQPGEAPVVMASVREFVRPQYREQL